MKTLKTLPTALMLLKPNVSNRQNRKQETPCQKSLKNPDRIQKPLMPTIMKTQKSFPIALILITMLLCISTNIYAQSNLYGGTAYVYAEDNRGKEVVLNATTEYLYSSESEARSALSKELKKWNHYKHTADIRYSIEKWDSDKRYEGYASATVIDSRGNEKKISISIDCDAVGLGYIVYFKTTLKSRLDREKSNNYDYISPISYRVNSCN